MILTLHRSNYVELPARRVGGEFAAEAGVKSNIDPGTLHKQVQAASTASTPISMTMAAGVGGRPTTAIPS